MSSSPMSTSQDCSLPSLLCAAPTDSNALARLVESEHERMRSWLVRVLRDEDLAADALQETWLILNRGQWRFVVHSNDGDGDARAWLRQIALRAALRLRERVNADRRILSRWWAREPQPRPVMTPLEQLEEQDRGAVVWAAVGDLPSSQREAVALRFRDGLDFAAIGRVQGCSALTARVRTWRGLSEVRRRLGVLGLLALPGLVRAALSIGGFGVRSAAHRVGFSAGFASLAPRWMACAGAFVVGVIALGTIWFANSKTAAALHMTSHITAAVTTEAVANVALGQTEARRPAWELMRPPAVESKAPDVPVEPDSLSETPLLYEIVIFEAPALLHLRDRSTILDAAQRAEMMSALEKDPRGKVLAPPRVLAGLGQQAVGTITQQHTTVEGYVRINDGVDRSISVFKEGNGVTVNGRATDGSILLTQATAHLAAVLGITNQHAVWTDNSGREQLLQWQEVTSVSQSTASLPAGGVWLAEGSSLLLPGQPGKIVRGTPAGEVPQVGSGDAAWWMLITPSAIDDHAMEPVAPPAEPLPSIFPSSTG